ncbi:hypothetical protein EJ05DRAFT_118501 [Pseudovirgaria hyperparasitica]|uniref:Rhodopsin domain-containing protein n=1 Tax=Pseudovirgaria hyperparasitica TaxID=470096 RepID=A0A6A6VWB9_9PEZI|nr:uncharacterized protein EJ05DRAFT_118501 [Pseudovirgaria hyperparasitica]KAF2754988.1 hypothetical protein EJ05DRAFT_118501 [Pseudovirgaria hyperparasitica]
MTYIPYKQDRSTLQLRQTSPPTAFSPEYRAYNNAPQIQTIVCTISAIGLLTGILRLYIRRSFRVLGSDDYVMMGTMLLALGTMICLLLETLNGIGRHIDTFQPTEVREVRLLIFVHSLFIVTGISSVKVSVGFFLMRLTTKASRYYTFIQGSIVFTLLFWLTCLIILIFQCKPIHAAWDTNVSDAKCYSSRIFIDIGITNSSVNIATDILFATIPIPLIWKLQLNTRTRISLVTVLGLGYFASAAAIVKAVKQATFFSTPDWTVHDSFNVWNVIELSVGMIAANLPCLKPLFNWFLDTARAISSKSEPTLRNIRTAGCGYHAAAVGYINRNNSDEISIALEGLTGPKDQYSGTPYGKTHTVIEGGAGENEKIEGKSLGWLLDEASRSDESILIAGRMIPPRGIMRTTEVLVSR